MASGIPNIAKGRINEFARRVNGNDPSTSVLKIVLLNATGLESLATLIDYDTLALLLAGASNEITVGGYARKVLTDADIADPTVDDTANTQSFTFADQTFGALAAGESVGAALIAYFPDTAGADSTAIPAYIVVPASPVVLNGEEFFFRTPSGLWSAG
jgi:hypothetical protein